MIPDTAVSRLKGIGPQRAQQLARLGIVTVGDLLECLPRDYRDLTAAVDLAQAHHGDRVALKGTFVRERTTVAYPRPGMTVVQARFVTDGQQNLRVIWYNQPWMARQLPEEKALVMGRLDMKMGTLRLINPVVETGEEMDLPVLPIYPLTQGINQRQMRQWVRRALEACPQVETLPESTRRELKLMERQQALFSVHFPESLEQMRDARRRLDCEAMLLYGALLREKRAQRIRTEQSPVIPEDPAALEGFYRALPYTPTAAQRRVIDEICADMACACPMNRLVQGDVGSGKTLVAMAALYRAAQCGYQGALMAPTEMLAQQLYEQAQAILAPLGVRVGKMTAGMGQKALRRARDYALVGSWDVVVGTHALIQKTVAFDRLALVVTDEQHRFGVLQRHALRAKGDAPHMLVMSATPVPRTLGLLLFADLDLSRVDELPPGRKPIKTRYVPGEKRADMYYYLARRAALGEQSYIVCPAIEEDEEGELTSVEALCARLTRGPMKDIPVEMIHGRMSAQAKEEVLERFRAGQVKVLIATTVIEVGINVPNATTIVIEDAHRFGLAQLHQLRGRVGRGSKESFCFLVSDQCRGPAARRIGLMTRCQDGFVLAEEDMNLRGPGEFLGIRQAGMDGQIQTMLRYPQLARQITDVLDALFSEKGDAGNREAILTAAHSRYARKLEEIVLN